MSQTSTLAMRRVFCTILVIVLTSTLPIGCASRQHLETTSRWPSLRMPSWPKSERHEESGAATVSANHGDLELPTSAPANQAEETPQEPETPPPASQGRTGDRIADLLRSKADLPTDPFLELERSGQLTPASASSLAQQTEHAIAEASVTETAFASSNGYPDDASQMDRLRDVLSGDTQRLDRPTESADEIAIVREQVAALLMRARTEIAENRLDAARMHAEDARELAEAVQLVFAPDETRPIEVLREVGSARAALAAADQGLADVLELPAPFMNAESPLLQDDVPLVVTERSSANSPNVAGGPFAQEVSFASTTAVAPVRRIPLNDVLSLGGETRSPGETASTVSGAVVKLTVPDFKPIRDNDVFAPLQTPGPEEVALPSEGFPEERFPEWDRGDRSVLNGPRLTGPAMGFHPDTIEHGGDVETIRLAELAPAPPVVPGPSFGTDENTIEADDIPFDVLSTVQLILLGASILAMLVVGIAMRRNA